MIHRAIALATLVFFATAAAGQADDPTTIAKYRQVVDQVIQLVAQSQRAAPDQRPELLKLAAALLASVQQVQTDSGERVTVNNDSLLKELNAASQDSQHAYISSTLPKRLAAIRGALADTPVTANDAELAELHDIYARPPFVQTPVENFLRQLQRRFNEWLDNLLSRTDSPVRVPSGIITWIGILVTLGVAAAFVITLRRNLAAEADLRSQADADAVTTSRAAISHAQKMARAGDYRSAVRMLYLATLLILDERGRLRYDKSLTNREYLRAVKDAPQIADALKPIVKTFDRTWYGFEDLSPEEFGVYEKQVDDVKKL